MDQSCKQSLVRKSGKSNAFLLILNVLDGPEIQIFCNIVGLSFVGQKQQLLRVVNLGCSIVSTVNRTVYHIDSADKCCFYKSVIARDYSLIEVNVKHDSLFIMDLLDNSEVALSLHFKRI